MTDLDYSFAPAPWELAASSMKPGDTLAAERLLLMLEGEDEDAAEQAMELLRQRHIAIGTGSLPKIEGSGLLSVRLRQEQQLARQGNLKAGLSADDPLRLCLEDMERSFVPVTQAGVEAALSGDSAGAEALTAGFFPEILKLACGYTGRGVALLDLIQDGCMGLLLALAEGNAATFREDALWQIDQAMARTVVLEARACGVGTHLAEGLEEYRHADRKLLDQLGRNPTLEEIAQEMGKTPEQAASLERMLRVVRTAAAVRQEKPEAPQPEDEQAVEDTAYFQSRQRIAELLSGLPEEDALLLRLRFGLEGGLPLSPEDVGNRLGLTPQEVVSREAAALAMLRQGTALN